MVAKPDSSVVTDVVLYIELNSTFLLYLKLSCVHCYDDRCLSCVAAMPMCSVH